MERTERSATHRLSNGAAKRNLARLLRMFGPPTLEPIYPESPWHVYTLGPPWPPAAWRVALMSADESAQILVVLLSTSFPPFVAARHVFASTNLVNLSACIVRSSEEVRLWRGAGEGGSHCHVRPQQPPPFPPQSPP